MTALELHDRATDPGGSPDAIVRRRYAEADCEDHGRGLCACEDDGSVILGGTEQERRDWEAGGPSQRVRGRP